MCLFCKIVARQIPASVVFEDDDILVFHDINPAAPVHVLVIPKEHLDSLTDASPVHQALLGKLLLAAKRVASLLGVEEAGYRVVLNTGNNAGQSVHHVHAHVLGGRMMAWPPG